MAFGGGAANVTVDFVTTDLQMIGTDNIVYKWTMDIGVIDPSFVTSDTTSYGINFNENMLGLAPMTLLSTDAVANEIDQR